MAALVAVTTSPSTRDTGSAAGTVTEILRSVLTTVNVTGTSWRCTSAADAEEKRDSAMVRARAADKILCLIPRLLYFAHR